jgi:cellulose synthase (UDP-forming)
LTTPTELTGRANHLKASPADEMSWRPLQRSTRVAVALALLASLYYLLFLLNPHYRGDTWLWIIVLCAEGLTVFQALGTWWTILAHGDEPPAPGVFYWRRLLLDGVLTPTVDVFITVAGEPIEIVRLTVRAAQDMQLEHKVWVLDDGDSDELRDHCADVGVGYLRREGRAHAKAGNVNAGLARTDGEFMLILDADFVPSPDFLVRALPYMHDLQVAFVQTPQSFPSAHGLVAEGAAEAQRIFYELVMPGKNHFNAVFCVGTNVIFRRAALEQIGGMYTASNSEDIWTALELHKRGWRSVFIPETLARGLAPDNLLSYFKQQFRWSYGGFEVLLRGKLFGRARLTLDQRFQYLLTGTNYLLSLCALTFMLLPAAYLLGGWSPIQGGVNVWLTHYLPFYALLLAVTFLQVGGFKPAAIITSIAAAPVHFRALVMAILKRKTGWTVTNAHSSGRLPGIELVLPHIAFVLINLTAIAVGLTVVNDPPATYLSIAWACLHLLILGRVIVEAVRGPGQEPRTVARRAAAIRSLLARPWPSRAQQSAEQPVTVPVVVTADRTD